MHTLLSFVATLAVSTAPVIDADPDAPVSGLEWRAEKVRATVGIVIPFASPRNEGFILKLPLLIELHNLDDTQVLPWEFWRARVALEAGWRLDPALAIIGSVEHESDHASDGSGFSGFVNLNSIAARIETRWELTPCNVLDAVAVLRLHVLTCTDDPEACGIDGGLGGSRAFEIAIGATWEFGALPPWSIFVATHGSWLVGHERAHEERRVSLRSGLLLAAESGRYAFFAELIAGSAVGYRRAHDVLELGAGWRWSP